MTDNRDDDPMTVLSGMMTDWFDAGVRDDMMRSFSEVNKRGMEAAGQLVARMTDLVDGATGHAAKYTAGNTADGDSSSERPAAESISGIRGDVLKSIDMWADMMTNLVDSSLEMMRTSETSPSARSLVIGPMHPGERTTQPMYAHAMLGQGMVRCRAGRFESARGACLSTGSVVVEPEIVIEGAEAKTTVVVDLPPDAVPGTYHGFVFADGVDTTALSVEIRITAIS